VLIVLLLHALESVLEMASVTTSVRNVFAMLDSLAWIVHTRNAPTTAPTMELVSMELVGVIHNTVELIVQFQIAPIIALVKECAATPNLCSTIPTQLSPENQLKRTAIVSPVFVAMVGLDPIALN